MGYHERGPGHGGAELVEKVGETHFGDDPAVAVIVDYRPIKVENHHHLLHCHFLQPIYHLLNHRVRPQELPALFRLFRLPPPIANDKYYVFIF